MTDRLHEERIRKLRTGILRVLNRINGGLLEENLLFADVNVHLSERVERSEFDHEISMLRDMGLIVTVRDYQLPSRKVRITAAGRAAFAEAESL